MKTPIQELIDLFIEDIKIHSSVINNPYDYTEWAINEAEQDLNIAKHTIKRLKSKLDKEKGHLMKAYSPDVLISEEWFNKTYNTDF